MFSSRPIVFTSSGLPLYVNAVLGAVAISASYSREVRCEVLGDPVDERLLLRAAADVGER